MPPQSYYWIKILQWFLIVVSAAKKKRKKISVDVNVKPKEWYGKLIIAFFVMELIQIVYIVKAAIITLFIGARDRLLLRFHGCCHILLIGGYRIGLYGLMAEADFIKRLNLQNRLTC
jgi:hypothetical protein